MRGLKRWSELCEGFFFGLLDELMGACRMIGVIIAVDMRCVRALESWTS